MPVQLGAGQSLICRKETFLCAEKSVTLDIAWQRRLGAGFFGGEGFVLQRVTGPGLVVLDLSGEVVERDLAPGQVLLVHAGHVGIMDPSVGFDIQRVKGFRNIVFGGEGPVPRHADRARPCRAAEHADHEPRRGDRPLPPRQGQLVFERLLRQRLTRRAPQHLGLVDVDPHRRARGRGGNV